MLFSSPIFLFCFLPAVLLGYYLFKPAWRNGFLLACNLVFYGWGEPVYVALMAVSILMNYGFGLWIEQRRRISRSARTPLVLSVAANLGLLGYFKYTGLFTRMLAALPGMEALQFPDILLPIGISFYTFQTMSYVIDVYRGSVPAQRNLVTFGTYVSLFPQLIAGPIVRYQDVESQLTYRRETLSMFASGVVCFAVGLGKKVLIANAMGEAFNVFTAAPAANGLLGSWIGIVLFAFQIYFDFSGYSDMAIGLGRMFGFEFMRNFNYPYISASITEFWRRWHISLSSWFRDYVYIPLGGSRGTTAKTIINLLIVWALTGLWHGASLNFVCWGLYYFALLVLEKFLFARTGLNPPKAVQIVYTLFFVLLGWVIFNFTEFDEMTRYMSTMFTWDGVWLGPVVQPLTIYMLPLMAVAAFASTPVAAKAYERMTPGKGRMAVSVTLTAGLLVLCTASMISGAYNPFLYFRF